ncbi:MAG: hypothetical protein ED556_01050 [Winogradskyella sp.]|uniref:hypothetical protein n=1 Tax=Winogradskyella sp. TaxID=1883156 RepID=UPI000F3E598B|nr:hypothetical protein [Winogradskyella sp.]RNC87808.1 MAG: hypothetical protein ED556_01050 [Winogradskyella sp.]
MKHYVLDTMKFRLVILVFIALGITANDAFGQPKQEREFSIQKKVLPITVIQFVDKLPKTIKRLRFYKEIDGNKESYEVKFKYQKQHFSCEFSIEGVLEDIEVIEKQKYLSESIKTYFKSNFKKAKLLKIQKQYVNDSKVNPNSFLSSIISSSNTLTINYEIIAEVTENSKRYLREFTFSSNGEFIGFRNVAPSSYGHVLY